MQKCFFLVLCLLLIQTTAQAEPAFQAQAAFEFLPKKPLNRSLLGVNAFVNDSRFGSISAQFREVKTVLGLKYVRVLFHWNDLIQSTPQANPFFGFYDEIASSLPSGVQALVIINGLPTWMDDPKNWIDNNPRKTFAKLWLEKVVKRYANNKKIKAFQVWNEPNMIANRHNITLDVADNPENYVELVALAQNIIKTNAPTKKVVTAATTAINQNYPESLNYNKAMKEAGIESLIDFWAIHIYSMRLENFIRPDNVTDFIKSLGKPVWVTESGEQGVNNQKNYAQQMWPFLFSTFPQIKRLYIYQFTDATSSNASYGLRTFANKLLLSDLYIYLRSLNPKASANKKR